MFSILVLYSTLHGLGLQHIAEAWSRVKPDAPSLDPKIHTTHIEHPTFIEHQQQQRQQIVQLPSILRGFLTCIVDCSRHDVCKNLGAHNPGASLLHTPNFQGLLFTQQLSSFVIHWPPTEIIFLLFNAGLYHMMPKWWIEQGQPSSNSAIF